MSRRERLGCDSSKSVNCVGHGLAAPASTTTKTLKTGQVASGRKAFREIECGQSLTVIGELWVKGRGCVRTPLMIGEKLFQSSPRIWEGGEKLISSPPIG